MRCDGLAEAQGQQHSSEVREEQVGEVAWQQGPQAPFLRVGGWGCSLRGAHSPGPMAGSPVCQWKGPGQSRAAVSA